MNNFKLLIKPLLLVLLCGCASQKPNAGNDGKFSKQPLRLTFERENETNYVVLVEFHYAGKEPVSVFYEDFPWYKRSLVLVAVSTKVREGRVLQRTPEIAGVMWVGSRKTVSPGDVLAGRIALDEWFPELRNEIAKSDVLLFWSYLPVEKGLLAQRLAGSLLIPKQP